MLVHLDNTFDSTIFVFSRFLFFDLLVLAFLLSYRRLPTERGDRNEDSEQLYKMLHFIPCRKNLKKDIKSY